MPDMKGYMGHAGELHDRHRDFEQSENEYNLHRDLLGRQKLSSNDEIDTRVRIVLSACGFPVTDENVKIAVQYMHTKSKEELDDLYFNVNEASGRKRLMRDLRKHINKEHARLELESNTTFQTVTNHLDHLTTIASSDQSYGKQADQDIQDIAKLLRGGIRFEKPQGTSLHHFLDYLHAGANPNKNMHVWEFFKNEFQSFVIEHNWAKAFEGVKDFDGGEVRLPFGYTCFEFRISGLRILCFLGESVDGTIEGVLASGVNKRWYINPNRVMFDGNKLYHPGADPVEDEIIDYLKLLGDQIRAVCIMLDAKVAVGERRAIGGPGLNKQRQREGKTPLKDYHVVTLAKRLRGHAERGEATGVHRRLHWRRGHWRHFSTPGGEVHYINADGITVSKTWINWQLVGDETLGFIDKHYKL